MATTRSDPGVDAPTKRHDDEATNTGIAGSTRRAAATVVDTVGTVATVVGDVAGDVGARLPEAATTGREALDEAHRVVRQGSDDTLKAAGALSVGLALGLFLGGAPRLLVVAALVPAGMIGMTLVERVEAARGTPKSMQRG